MAKKKIISDLALARLIERITKDTQPLNDYFSYYGHKVTLQSGSRDFVQVYIDKDISFSFDFWTKKLHIAYTANPNQAKVIKKTFDIIYGKNRIKLIK